MTNPNDDYIFDANQHDPESKPEPVPADTYNVVISDTDIVDMDQNKGWYLKVAFKIADGAYQNRVIINNYNIGHLTSAEAARIAHGQLSALSHVTGRFTVSKNAKGGELRGAALKIRVINDGTYNQVKEVFDVNGNKPTKAGSGPSTGGVAAHVASPAPAGSGWGAPAAVVAPAPIAAPAAPAAFPPAGWTAHPDAPGYFYQGSEVLAEADLRARLAPAPAAAPIPPAAPAAAAPAWNQAPAAAAPSAAAPWGAPAA